MGVGAGAGKMRRDSEGLRVQAVTVREIFVLNWFGRSADLSKSNDRQGKSERHAMKLIIPLCSVAVICAALSGCGLKTEADARAKSSNADESDMSPEERQFVAAAEPFLKAIAARSYDHAYGQLSSHARARMSSAQFVPPDLPERAPGRPSITLNATAQDFALLMQRVEREHGLPNAVKNAHVFSTDVAVLSGQGDALESMFAIGGMPSSVPVGIRKASIRCQIGTKLTPEQLKEVAKEAEITPEELLQSADFDPYFNLKLVLVEEAGVLRVGYFEFMPPSMFD